MDNLFPQDDFLNEKYKEYKDMDYLFPQDDFFNEKYKELKGENQDVDFLNLINRKEYESFFNYATNCYGYYKNEYDDDDDNFHDCKNYICYQCGITFNINDAENIEMLYEIFLKINEHIGEHSFKCDKTHCFCDSWNHNSKSYYTYDDNDRKQICCLECKAMFEDENNYILK